MIDFRLLLRRDHRSRPRPPAPVADTRALALSGLDLTGRTVLEIGPLARPVVPRDGAGRVYYMDHAPTEHLREKYAAEPSVDIDGIVEVDFVAADGRIAAAIGEMLFDVIVASHVVEHVPDLIGWLKEAEAALAPGGTLALVVPDKRYTFDVLRRLSPKYEVRAAFEERRIRPGAWAVADHFANVVQADTEALWRDGPKAALEFPPIHIDAHLSDALALCRAGQYVDCHAWVFTPDHFRDLFEWGAREYGLRLRIARFETTRPGNLEFYVQLRNDAPRR